MYGVSAFAGMIQIFTAPPTAGGEVTGGADRFPRPRPFRLGNVDAQDRTLRVTGAFNRRYGWQDRTESDVERGSELGFGWDAVA